MRRSNSKGVTLIPANKSAGSTETAHLLRSSRNAQRLLRALRRAEKGGGKPATVEKLRLEMKFER